MKEKKGRGYKLIRRTEREGDKSTISPKEYKELLDEVREIATRKSNGAVIVLKEEEINKTTRTYSGRAIVHSCSKADVLYAILKTLDINPMELMLSGVLNDMSNKNKDA